MADAVTGGNDIGLRSANIPEAETWCFTTQKRQNTNIFRRQNHNGQVLTKAGSWFCCCSSQTCVYCFTCRLVCTGTTKCAHFLVGKGFCEWKHSWRIHYTN